MATHGQGVHTFGAYLETVEQNFDGDGFEAHPDTPEGYRTDTYHRRRFELSKFGFVDTFVVGETVYRESRQSPRTACTVRTTGPPSRYRWSLTPTRPRCCTTTRNRRGGERTTADSTRP